MLFNVRTEYSLLNSTLKVADYVRVAHEYGYKKIGIADINVLSGAVHFYQECQKYDIEPMIGMTVKMSGWIKSQRQFTFLLYAVDLTGYEQLMKLSTYLSQNEISLNVIKQFFEAMASHVVYLTTGKESELDYLLFNGMITEAEELVETLQILLGNDYVYYGQSAYPYNRKEFEKSHLFAQKLKMPLVMNQLIEMLYPRDAFSLRVLKAIQANETTDLLESELMGMQGAYAIYPKQEWHDMVRMFPDDDIWQKTQDLTEKLAVAIPLDQAFLPKFPTPNHESATTYLHQLIMDSLREKGLDTNERYVERAKYELDVIAKMGFSDYFLIVWEILDYCRRTMIRVGPGRGSAAGSLVSYLLHITQVDPIEYDLLFERFLNPERQSMPDIDVDVPDNQREKVLKHIEQYYGHQCVAQIGTIGTFGAKQSIRDTLRVLGASSTVLKQWANAIPRVLNITLDQAYEQSYKLRQLIAENEQNQRYFQIARTIEGLPRHFSTHAAGIVIHETPLKEVIPLIERPNQMALTQFTMYDVEKIGLLKMDILGLRNLSLLEDILDNVKQLKENSIEIESINKNDPETLRLFQEGKTNGVFQFESEGIKQVLRQLKPTSFEDVVAVNALYRPGPMRQIDAFIQRKHGDISVDYLHPALEPILKSTYGIIVYQEQVMQICQQLAGFSLGEADLLRRAMAKKQADVMETQRRHFIQGAIQKDIDEALAQKIYDYIEAFASYGFNRSHAVVYSTLAYELAYLKVHEPLAFYKAILNQGRSNLTSFSDYLQEAKQVLDKILPIDVNRSQAGVSIDQMSLRIGFDLVKGIKKELVQHILNDRDLLGEYTSIQDFLQRLPKKLQKEEIVEPLIFVGAFDSLGYNRATLQYNLSLLLQRVVFLQPSLNLFDSQYEAKIEWQEELAIEQLRQKEIDLLGFSLLPHPIEAYRDQITLHDQWDRLQEMTLKRKTKAIVYIQDIRVIQTKKGDPMAFLTVFTGKNDVTVTVFPDVFIRANALLKRHAIVMIEGIVEHNQRGERQIIAKRISNVLETKKTGPIRFHTCFIKVLLPHTIEESKQYLQTVLEEFPGPCRIVLVDDKRRIYELPLDQTIGYPHQLQMQLKQYFGEENVVFK